MAYSASEIKKKQSSLVSKIMSIEKKDVYTQALSGNPNRNQVGKGGGDCSSTQQWVYKQVLGIDIGGNTTSQSISSKLVDVKVEFKNGIPNEKQMELGDLIYFRGSDSSRASYGCVGHVEMYIGDGKIMGHGCGKGPFIQDLAKYCTFRKNQKTATKYGTKEAFKVRRAKVLMTSETKLISSENKEYYNKCSSSQNSFVDALKEIKVDSSKEMRAKIANKNGISNYTGTATQNCKLLTLLKLGKLIKA